MKYRKLLALMLASAMLVLSFTGCSGSSAEDEAQREEESDKVEEEKEEEKSADAPALKGPGNVTLSALGFNLDFDPNEDVMAGVIEEATGYEVEYSMLPSDGANEKLVADVAGGVEYDILKLNMNQYYILLTQGALMPLNDLLEAYGQDILNGVDEKMWNTFSDDAGDIYGIPFMREYQNQVSYIMCRLDLMEAAGITEVPTTLDDFYNCLVTLKEYYGDEYIILSASTGWDAVGQCIASGFGIYNDWMTDENGNVFYMTEHPNFEAYMEYMKKLYDEGLLDSEYAVNTSNTVQEKLSSSQAIMGSAGHANQNSISTSLVENFGVAKEQIGYVNPLMGEDGTCTYYDANNGVNFVTCILKSCENAADAINFINLKVQNQEYICIGEEGVHFEFDEEGRYVPIHPIFGDEKGYAWWYINATDAESYEKQWQARIKKSEYQWDAFEKTTVFMNENHPEIFMEDVFMYKPSQGAYAEKNAALKTELLNYLIQVVVGTNDVEAGLETFTSDWAVAGGEEVKTDLQTWYTESYQ